MDSSSTVVLKKAETEKWKFTAASDELTEALTDFDPEASLKAKAPAIFASNFKAKPENAEVEPEGASKACPPVQFFSLSCGFWQTK